MPSPTLRKKEKKKRGSGHLGYSDSYPPIFFCNHTNTYRHTYTPANTNTLNTKTRSNSNVLCFSLLHTYTHKHVHTPTGRLYRVPASMSNLAAAQIS